VKKKPSVALFPGSFDPVTNGHLDLIDRTLKVFDQVVVAILLNPDKRPLFTVEERVAILREVCRRKKNVGIGTFSGLLVDYAVKVGASSIVRGLRAISDFEYEFQMALMNRRLDPRIDTVFLMAPESYSYLSSRLVKEVFHLGGSITGLVPPLVERRLRQKMLHSPPARRRRAR
jgi:pantetheine-phosphate adenylyltransferase